MPLKHTVEEIRLKNGAKGLFIYVPGTTSVHYDVSFRAGNDYARDPSISQVAHIMEHMSFGANEKYANAEAFSQEFSRNGANSNAFTSHTTLNYTANCGIMEWERILKLQELAITKSTYTQEALDSEKGNVREEIIGYANDYGRVLWQTIMRQSGLKRWYDPDELQTIDAVMLDDIKEHFARTHTTRNMKFVFAGDLEAYRDTLIAQLDEWGLPEGEELPLSVDNPHSSGLVHIKRAELPNLTFNFQLIIKRTLNRRELRAMNVLCHILTDTMHSRIWGKARTRGICYGMGSWIDSNVSGMSDFGLGGQVSFENAAELFELIIRELDIISREGVTKEELDQAKEFRLGAMQMGTETVRSLAAWYLDIYYDYGTIDYVDNMPALIKGTTLEEIKALANEFLSSDTWTFGAIGNIEKEDLQEHYDRFAKAFQKR